MSDLEVRDEARKTWRERIGDLFASEPADRRELLEMLRDASERRSSTAKC